jgi:CRISPR-associated endonuclease/helicase Cas3
MNFEDFFRYATKGWSPRPYQSRLAEQDWPETRIIPTGFGKTAAVFAAWLWKRSRTDPDTPRRLVYCLPMRTLVEQTEAVAKQWIDAGRDRLGFEQINLEVLMGGQHNGRSTPEWILRPELPAILIGTQDILVSSALMRGYGTSRCRWPVDFALLHNDALWIFDEVQLAGASLLTSAQLEAFRREFKTSQPSRTLWMSATLDPDWLATVDFKSADSRRPHDLSSDDLSQADQLWKARKALAMLDIDPHDLGKKDAIKSYVAALAEKVCAHMRPNTNTILFLNTVARAQAVFKALQEQKNDHEILLIHSRFRAADRARLTKRLTDAPPSAGRIVAATQALEAGVDVTSAVMITEIAPWSSLVQRFGRCNRYGERDDARVIWIDLPADAAAPYEEGELAEAREKLAGLSSCGPADLAAIAPSAPRRGQVIRKRDLLDLFDTDPDLSGFDVDVAMYVRDADDTDVRLFWRPVPSEDKAPSEEASAPLREELCPAPIGRAKELVKRASGRVWRWDSLARQWSTIREDDVFPGVVLWIDAAVGGYDRQLGFEPASKSPVEPIEASGDPSSDIEDNRESNTSKVRVSLAKHTEHVRKEAAVLADALGMSGSERTALLDLALWHDWGKAHEAFVALTRTALTNGVQPPLAKWPHAPKGMPRPEGARKYFRHELASALGFLARHDWIDQASLPAYLIAAHHGKVRMRIRALPDETPAADGKLFARGVHDGDLLPKTQLGDLEAPETALDLDLMQLGDGKYGASWSARTEGLLREHGPFRLAWLEALLRIADWRASAAEDELTDDDL